MKYAVFLCATLCLCSGNPGFFSQDQEKENQIVTLIDSCVNCVRSNGYFYKASQQKLGPIHFCSPELKYLHDPMTVMTSFAKTVLECPELFRDNLLPKLPSPTNSSLFKLLENPEFLNAIKSLPSGVSLVLYYSFGN